MESAKLGGRTICLIIVVLLVLADRSVSLNFKMAANEEMCFHELTHRGNKVLAFFDVMSWGYGAYVSLTVKSPSGKVVKQFDSQSEGKIDYFAEEDGEQTFCFKNTRAETELSFWINIETDYGLSQVAKEDHVSDMTYSVENLHGLVTAAKIDLLAFKAREGKHRKMAESNKKRIFFWAIFECFLILLVAVGQVLRIRKFFESKLSV